MKILNARTGALQSIPFTLGETGRGRHAEEIRISNRPGQEPSGPEDVSYFLFGPEGRQHCILTRGDQRRGVLLRIDTKGVYTRDSGGRISLIGGPARCLASGTWAEGDAGRIGSGPDQLWHVEGPAVWEVVIQGGSHKGYGLRYLVVGRSMAPRMLKPDELIQMIATDSDPDVTEAVRPHAAALAAATGPAAERGREIHEAFRLADQLEEFEPAADAPTVQHYSTGDLRAEVERHGIATPAAYAQIIGGVSNVQSGTLVPGRQPLLSLEIGPGGGRRYSYEIVTETGVRRIGQLSQRPYTHESVLFLVEDQTWQVAWVSRRDGADTEYAIADAGGIHTYTPACSDPIRTQAWPGLSEGPAPNFGSVFQALEGIPTAAAIAAIDTAGRQLVHELPTPTQVSDLAAKFNRH